MDWLTIWLTAGICLLVIEMMSGTFVLMFLSLGCFAAAMADYLGSTELNTEVAIGVAISLLGLVIWRKTLQKRLTKQISVSSDIGKEIVVDQETLPGQSSRISYQGTTWNAVSVDSEVIKSGQPAQIVGIDGNSLLIRNLRKG